MKLPLLRRSTKEEIGEFQIDEDGYLVSLTGDAEAASRLIGTRASHYYVRKAWSEELSTELAFTGEAPATPRLGENLVVLAWFPILARHGLLLPSPYE